MDPTRIGYEDGIERGERGKRERKLRADRGRSSIEQ